MQKIHNTTKVSYFNPTIQNERPVYEVDDKNGSR